jgi:Na+/phosphate symporter
MINTYYKRVHNYVISLCNQQITTRARRHTEMTSWYCINIRERNELPEIMTSYLLVHIRYSIVFQEQYVKLVRTAFKKILDQFSSRQGESLLYCKRRRH